MRWLNPVFKFRLYVNESRTGLFVLVNVWPSRSAMRRHAREVVNHHARRYLMFCTRTRITYADSGRLSPMFAEVNLQVGYKCVGAVSHELVHATSAYFARVGLVHTDDTDEVYAHVQGWLLLQYIHHANRVRLYE